MTYGQIAYLLGEGYTPRTVGFVMHGADETRTPWQRVVLPADKQQRMLERERVKFDASGRCDLEKYLWHPRAEKVEPAKVAKAGKSLYRR